MSHFFGVLKDCPICGAALAESQSFPWHLPSDDCRSIRTPVDPDENRQQAREFARSFSARRAR